MRQLTDAEKIAIVDTLCQRAKRQTRCNRAVPVYEWTISSTRHCDIASALLEMVPPEEPVRPWPKWKKSERVWGGDQGFGFFGFV